MWFVENVGILNFLILLGRGKFHDKTKCFIVIENVNGRAKGPQSILLPGVPTQTRNHPHMADSVTSWTPSKLKPQFGQTPSEDSNSHKIIFKCENYTSNTCNNFNKTKIQARCFGASKRTLNQ